MIGFGDFFWYLLWIFYFTVYIFMVFLIISDLFRDHKLNGWWKAVWIIFLIFMPFLTALVYVIARGHGMTQRDVEQAQAHEQAFQSYVRDAAGTSTGGMADELTKLADLKERGAITDAEFADQKAKLLA